MESPRTPPPPPPPHRDPTRTPPSPTLPLKRRRIESRDDPSPLFPTASFRRNLQSELDSVSYPSPRFRFLETVLTCPHVIKAAEDGALLFRSYRHRWLMHTLRSLR